MPLPPPVDPTAIGVACSAHRGPSGFVNLVVERRGGEEVVLDPHVTCACVQIIFDEGAATALLEIRW